MDWLKNWNKSFDCLELHLDGKINLEELGRLAGCSAYHFPANVFLSARGAAQRVHSPPPHDPDSNLKNGGRVLEVALRYGYDSPTAFNRTFQKVMGYRHPLQNKMV